MRFLYVAPRFHPNQYPIVQGLINNGHTVNFCVARVGVTEKHGDVNVDILRPNLMTKLLEKFFERKGKNYVENKMVFFFSPSKKDVSKLLEEFNPDVVVLRERNLLSRKFFSVCKSLKIKNVILYNQSPIYENAVKHNCRYYLKLLYRKMFPRVRITVCRYREYPDSEKKYEKDSEAYFLPFIVRNSEEDFSREYAPDGIVRIFDCGKYREYKNHYILADAAKKLLEKGLKNFHVTVIGQADNEEEQEYYNNFKKYVFDNGLASFFSINKSVPYDEMPGIYMSQDVFVLTSKKELANVSILDSMSYGLATITTSANGTADYVSNGETGYVFKTNSIDDLSEKLQTYLKDISVIKKHGNAAIKIVNENYNFKSYYNKLMDIIERIE